MVRVQQGTEGQPWLSVGNKRFVSRPCALTLWLKINLHFLADFTVRMPHPLLFYTFYWCLSRYLTFSGIVQDMYARFPSAAMRDIFVGNGKLIFPYIWPQKWCWSSILSLTSAHLNSSLCHGVGEQLHLAEEWLALLGWCSAACWKILLGTRLREAVQETRVTIYFPCC